MEDVAAPMRRRSRPLAERLRLEPHAFDLLQLVHLLERLAPDRPTVGTTADASSEAAVLRGSFARRFPPSEVESVAWPDAAAPEVTVASFGLGGAMGPLPTPASEAVADAARRGQTAARDFLDLANHRLIAKFLALRRRRHAHTEPHAPFEGETARVLRALLGLAEGVREPADRALLPLAGLLARRPFGLDALQRALAHLLDTEVRARPFAGRWLQLARGQQARLGGNGAKLGRSGTLGRSVYDPSAAVGVRIGPIASNRVAALLPGGADHASLRRNLAFLVDRRCDVDLELLTRPEEVPRARLGADSGTRLGWTAWLGGLPQGALGRTHLRLDLVPGTGPGHG